MAGWYGSIVLRRLDLLESKLVVDDRFREMFSRRGKPAKVPPESGTAPERQMGLDTYK